MKSTHNYLYGILTILGDAGELLRGGPVSNCEYAVFLIHSQELCNLLLECHVMCTHPIWMVACNIQSSIAHSLHNMNQASHVHLTLTLCNGNHSASDLTNLFGNNNKVRTSALCEVNTRVSHTIEIFQAGMLYFGCFQARFFLWSYSDVFWDVSIVCELSYG